MIRRRSRSAGSTWAIAPESISCRQRCCDSQDEERGDDAEREPGSGLPPALENELEADEDEHQRDRLVEVAEATEHISKQDEERGKAEEREDVSHPDQERVPGDRKACGNRVDRKGDVR